MRNEQHGKLNITIDNTIPLPHKDDSKVSTTGTLIIGYSEAQRILKETTQLPYECCTKCLTTMKGGEVRNCGTCIDQKDDIVALNNKPVNKWRRKADLLLSLDLSDDERNCLEHGINECEYCYCIDTCRVFDVLYIEPDEEDIVESQSGEEPEYEGDTWEEDQVAMKEDERELMKEAKTSARILRQYNRTKAKHDGMLGGIRKLFAYNNTKSTSSAISSYDIQLANSVESYKVIWNKYLKDKLDIHAKVEVLLRLATFTLHVPRYYHLGGTVEISYNGKVQTLASIFPELTMKYIYDTKGRSDTLNGAMLYAFHCCIADEVKGKLDAKVLPWKEEEALTAWCVEHDRGI